MSDFEAELTILLNRHSLETNSNTPDFILAQYLGRCLEAFHLAVQARIKWYDEDYDTDLPTESGMAKNLS